MSPDSRIHAPETSALNQEQEPTLNVLLVEDNPGDARLIQEYFSEARGSTFNCVWAQRLRDAIQKIGEQPFDAVILDLSLPDSQGFETFNQINMAAPGLPIVVLTGLDDEKMALKAVRRGAQEYLVKDRMESNLLERVTLYSIERQRIQRELRDLNANLEERVAERTQELSAAYEALFKANEKLLELDHMKSAFIKLISHELRTPLTPICGMLAILPARLTEEQKDLEKCCQSATRASQRLDKLVVRILEMAEKGEYHKQLDVIPIDVGDLLNEAFDEVAPFVELRGHTLSADVPDSLPPIELDPDKVRDVLVNLLMNAIKFTPDGGKITCGVRLLNAQTMEFSVQDTGVGISENDKPHVFKEFFTSFDWLHHSSGEYEFEKRGVGFGLAIVKKFVEMHGGEVHLESTPGEGSTFYFTIPIIEYADLESEEHSTPAAQQQ